MSSYKILPSEHCLINLDYVIAKNQEVYATMNMIIFVSLIINLIMYKIYTHSKKKFINTLTKYVDIMLLMNTEHDLFDTKEVNVFNPYELYDYYADDVESDATSDATTDDVASDAEDVASDAESDATDDDATTDDVASDAEDVESDDADDVASAAASYARHGLRSRNKHWEL
jgi:hypothetical protein